MAAIQKFTLSDEELAELRDLQDKYNVSVKVVQDTFGANLMRYWNVIRQKHDLLDCPFHVLGKDVWYLDNANTEEQNAFIAMTTKRGQ